MTILTLGACTVRCDPTLTRALYAQLEPQVRAACCDTCANLALVLDRDDVFPSAFANFLQSAGVDLTKPVEAVETYQLSEGFHHYSGFYFIAGSLESGPDALSGPDGFNNAELVQQLSESMSCYFSTRLSFGDVPFAELASCVQVHWEAVLPWVYWDPPYLRNPGDQQQ